MENGSKGASRRVQDLIVAAYIEPARRRHESTVRVTAGELARALKLVNRGPQVCTAMQGQRFLQRNHLEILKRKGPPSGAASSAGSA